MTIYLSYSLVLPNYYCSSHETCPIAFSEELTYWGISELFVEPCCQETYYGRKDMMKKASQREEDDMFIFPNTCIGRSKQWWWYLFEYPTLSLRSRIVAIISFFFVMLSTIVLVVSTLLEDIHRNDPNCKWDFYHVLVIGMMIREIDWYNKHWNTISRQISGLGCWLE